MNLTRPQISALTQGHGEINNMVKSSAEEKKYTAKSSNAKDFFNRGGNTPKPKSGDKAKDSDSFYQLFSIPGIRMTEQAQKKFLDSKRKMELNKNE